MQRCKTEAAHGRVDTLLDRIAVASLADVNALKDAFTCRRCDHQLGGGAEGSRRASKPPPVQIITRVMMDRRRSSAKDGALFSYAQLVRGVRFAGQIRRIPERSRAHLARALAGPLSLGRARSLGWGSIKILRTDAPAPLPSLEERARAFDKALAARLGKDHPRLHRLVPFTLLSPLVLRDGEDDGCATLAEALGIPGLTWPVVARRFDLERGWDQRHGRRDVVRVARAGAVFVAELPAGQRLDDVLPALARIEQEGAGGRLRMGFGRVICFDPLIGQGARKP